MLETLSCTLLAAGGLAAAPPAAAPAGSFDAADLAAFVDPIIEHSMTAEHVPGAAVVIVKDGRIVLARGYGLADVDAATPVDADATLFRIGSISKAVTALAAVQAIDHGELNLDGNVNDSLDAITVEDRYPQPVTLYHLLTHTAGFDQPGRDRNFDNPADRPALGSFLQRDLRRIRPPGRDSCYDTYGISLAGYLVGERSGLGYVQHMRDRVFEPLGMTRTWIEAPAGLATGYSYDDGRYVPQGYEYYASLPASSVDSTVTDMARLMIAVLGDGSNEHGRLYSPAVAERVKHEPQYRVRPNFAGFAWGFFELDRHGQRVLSHGGTMRGFSSELELYPDHGLGVFATCNRDSESGPPTQLVQEVCAALAARWFPGEPAAPTPPGEPQPVDTARLAGRYAGNLYCHTCPAGDGWPPPETIVTIESIAPGVIRSPSRRYYALDPLTFADESGRYVLAFTEDDQGRIAGMAFNGTAPGSSSERLDDRLLEEVLGPSWPDQPAAPLAAHVYRANDRWAEAAAAYDRIAATQADGEAAQALALLSAGECHARLGHEAEAVSRLEAARELFGALAARPKYERVAPERLRQTFYWQTAAYAVAGNNDAAFALIQRVIGEYGLPTSDVMADLGNSPLFAGLIADPRAQALAGQGGAQLAAGGGWGWSMVHCDLELDLRPDRDALSLRGRTTYRLERDASDVLTIGINSRDHNLDFVSARTPDVATQVQLNDTIDAMPVVRLAHVRAATPWHRGDDVVVEFELVKVGEGMQLEMSGEAAFASWVTAWYPAPLPDLSAGEGFHSGLVAAPGTTRVVMPAGWRCVTSGAMTDRTATGDRAIETWTVAHGLARSFAAGPYEASVDETAAGTVGIYLLSPKPATAATQARVLGEAVRVMSDRFGAYPYEQFSIAEVPPWVTGFSASSEQGFIMVTPPSLEMEGGNLPLFAHEAAHGWFGNLVGASGPGAPWCTEGLAQFAAVVAIESLEGAEAATEFLRFSRPGYNTNQCAEGYFRILRSGRDVAIGTMQRGGGVNHTIVDAKGHWVFHMLRRRVGDETFFSTMRELIETHAGGAMTVETLRSAFRDAAPDARLDRFFAQWLDQPGAPVLDATWVDRHDGTVEVTLTQAQPGEPYDLDVELEVVARDGTTKRHTVGLRDRESSFVLAAPPAPIDVAIDTDHRLLIWTPEYGPRPDR